MISITYLKLRVDILDGLKIQDHKQGMISLWPWKAEGILIFQIGDKFRERFDAERTAAAGKELSDRVILQQEISEEESIFAYRNIHTTLKGGK